MSTTRPTPGETLDARDAAALTECMSVLEDVGRARGAAGLYEVIGQHGQAYLVDVATGACECGDSFYRALIDGCKHVRRVEYATGVREIPAWVDRAAVDPLLGQFVDGCE